MIVVIYNLRIGVNINLIVTCVDILFDYYSNANILC